MSRYGLVAMNYCIRIVILLTSLVSYFASGSVATPTDRFDIPEGAYNAEFVRNLGNVVQIRFTGDYNRELSNGDFNRSARAVVAQEFYTNHADEYDILLVFSEFDVDTGDAAAFHVGVRNDVEGINKPIYDISDLFGSDGVLASYIDFAETSRWDLDPAGSKYASLMATSMHEIMHRWVIGVHIMDDGEQSDILIGQKDSHWSALLDSDASFMYGHDWMNSGSSGFLAFDQRQRYSALDLYLAGFYSPENVGPIYYIDSSDLNAEDIYKKGTVVSGEKRVFSIDDIIAAEGERVPDYQASQKNFKAAVIYLTNTTDYPDSLTVKRLNQYADNVALQFSQYTGGIGILNVSNISKSEAEESDDEVVLRSELNTDLALYWLRSQQNDGYWQDSDSTLIRDSVVANQVLSELDSSYDDTDFSDWVAEQDSVTNVDDAAYLARFGLSAPLASLVTAQNSDYGWGLSESYNSTVFDSAVVLSAYPEIATNDSVEFIISLQNADGGWPLKLSGTSDLSSSALSLYALSRIKETGNTEVDTLMLEKASSYISQKLISEEYEASPAELGMLLFSDVILKYLDSDVSDYLYEALSVKQNENGSWSGSVYETAIILSAIYSADFPNLNGSIEGDFPTVLSAGEPVHLTTIITNSGDKDASEFDIALYLDSESDDNLLATKTIGELASAHSVSLDWDYETSEGSGNQRVIVVIDPDESILEKTRNDNVFFKDYEITSTGTGSLDVGVYSGDIIFSPESFDAYTEDFSVSGYVRNISDQDCTGGVIYLLGGDGSADIELAQSSISVAAGEQGAFSFSATLPPYNLRYKFPATFSGLHHYPAHKKQFGRPHHMEATRQHDQMHLHKIFLTDQNPMKSNPISANCLYQL
jgi:hypothetical protein